MPEPSAPDPSVAPIACLVIFNVLEQAFRASQSVALGFFPSNSPPPSSCSHVSSLPSPYRHHLLRLPFLLTTPLPHPRSPPLPPFPLPPAPHNDCQESSLLFGDQFRISRLSKAILIDSSSFCSLSLRNFSKQWAEGHGREANSHAGV